MIPAYSMRTYSKRPLRTMSAQGLGRVKTLSQKPERLASTAVSAGIPLPFVQEMLGHKRIATTQRYAKVAPDAVRQAVEQAASLMARAMSGGASTAEVVPMPKAKG